MTFLFCVHMSLFNKLLKGYKSKNEETVKEA